MHNQHFAACSHIKARKTARIRKRYNQVPHLSQDTTWESNKIAKNITNKSREVSPFPSGDHKAAMNRRKIMTNTRQMIHKRSTAMKRSVKYFTGGLERVKLRAYLTLNLHVDQDTYMFGLHERPLTYPCIIS